ncbi:MAG TPA: ROK family protein [Bryobacterales bacterium]|nr:ROK family protein [Bryobacterales bacterium]
MTPAAPSPAGAHTAIGLDVGGTSARTGLVTTAGKLLFQASARTGLRASGQALLDRFRRCVGLALGFAQARSISVAGIGIGMPGLVDEAGCVAGSCNLPSLNGVPVAQLLEKEFRLPVRMENDVSAGACGEYYFGGHRRSRRFLFLSIGTGVGGGMLVDGEMLRLTRGCLGDPGHIIVDASGSLPCRCGGNGCLEAAASGWALVERASPFGVETPKQLFDRARAGPDPGAALARIAQDAAAAVGVGLATFCVLLNPDTIVLGGGVATEAGEPFRAQAEQAMRRHAAPFFSQDVRVLLTKAGPAAGLLGSASLILFSR